MKRPQALYYLTLGELLRHRDFTSGESSALTPVTQTVEGSTLLELITLALLASALRSRCSKGEKGRERKD
eukprot:848364-Rhodomonas_salina.1